MTEKKDYSSFTFLEQLPMGCEQLPRTSKYQKSRKLFIASESKSLLSCSAALSKAATK
jgi:hypothetical protein